MPYYSDYESGYRTPARWYARCASIDSLYRNQLAVDEILLYDDLIARAREASYRLAAHAVGSPSVSDG